MHLSAKIWSCLSYVANILTLSAVDQDGSQRPLGSHNVHVRPSTNLGLSTAKDGPIFLPPGWRLDVDEKPFECDYTAMKGWKDCSQRNRSCWLEHEDGRVIDIHTNYEDFRPIGKRREYVFNVTDEILNTDGLNFTNAKLVNNQYPGPYLQACWGDTISVKVINSMKYNGTAVHWHGIRQLRSMHMDGVPGITQCPIAPGDTFTYEFNATQYGSAWYHSHYSVQYADGLLGPMTIYGPHSVDWDEAKFPILMTDWFHNSAYSVIHGKVPGYPTVLLNGTGDLRNYQYSVMDDSNGKNPSKLLQNTSLVPPTYRLHFEPQSKIPSWLPIESKPKRYLLRLINTSFGTGFVFSIDHHMLEVISADFVPVKPFKTTHLHVGIGQRYNVIVTAKPTDYPDGTMANNRKLFWIRTTASPCFRQFGQMGLLKDYDRTGILSYYNENGYDPKDKPPDTKRWPQIDGDEGCRDEDRELFKPIVPWRVGCPANKEKNGTGIEPNDADYDCFPYLRELPERFDVVADFMFKDEDKPEFKPHFPVARFSFERITSDNNTFDPMQIDYDMPIIRELGRSKPWPSSWAVVNETENITSSSWIYLAIAGRHIGQNGKPISGGGNRGYTAGAHPIHLHGHDFAILQQEDNLPLNLDNIDISFDTRDNPLRRDVALLPAEGFLIIAFKADNPGSWIMHCHIAFHASEGLALQVMERQWDAYDLFNGDEQYYKDARSETNRICKNWEQFRDNCMLHWPGKLKDFECYPACNNDPDPKKRKEGCKNLLYDDSGI